MKLVLYFLDTSEKIFEGKGKKEETIYCTCQLSWQLVSVAKWQYLPPKNEDLADFELLFRPFGGKTDIIGFFLVAIFMYFRP